jgi:DNA phosphorothioation-associated putative methyltransferase
MILRDRTAIRRTELSRPVRAAVKDGIVSSGTAVLDYGCGLGDDVRRLQEHGIAAFGWDPAHHPDGEKRSADVVNLGYVVNVVERPDERAASLRDAWGYARSVLIVAARLKAEYDARFSTYEDGCVTRLQTFQKFYEQQELRDWITATLGEVPVAAAPGVFYVFRDDAARESFIASRYHRRVAAPRIRLSDKLFEEHQGILQDLMGFVTERGRLPEQDELPVGADLAGAFGSVKRAFHVVRRVTGTEQWDAITAERRNDLLVYLALGRFPRRPKLSSIPVVLKRDIKGLFGTYKTACAEGDALLFAAGDMTKVDAACKDAPFGKLMPTALYVHAESLNRLPGLLRVYEGCARVLSGTIEGTTIIKLRRHEPKISYLSYPAFEDDPHPSLASSVRVDLRSFHLKYRDYASSDDPPVLHRKEAFVPSDAPLRGDFATLTHEEEAWGLLEDPSVIGTKKAWEEGLARKGARLVGHHVVARDASGPLPWNRPQEHP